jgi:hypothetical protein
MLLYLVLFALFYILSPGIFLSLPRRGSKQMVALTHAIVFVGAFYLAERLFHMTREGFQSQIKHPYEVPPYEGETDAQYMYRTGITINEYVAYQRKLGKMPIKIPLGGRSMAEVMAAEAAKAAAAKAAAEEAAKAAAAKAKAAQEAQKKAMAAAEAARQAREAAREAENNKIIEARKKVEAERQRRMSLGLPPLY